MKHKHNQIGNCLLCGSKVEEDMLFFDSGDGYIHDFCIDIRKRAM